MKTKFYLRKGKQKLTINFEFRNGVNTKFRASTGFSIYNEKDWNFLKQKMKLPSSTLNASLINTKLSEMNNKLDKLYLDKDSEDVKLEFVKVAFHEVFGTKKNNIKHQNTYFESLANDEINGKDFIEYYDWFLIFYSKNQSPYSKRILTQGTLKTLNNTLSILKKYLEEKKIKNIYFDDINRIFYHDFLSFLNKKKYTKNYIGTIIQKIKTVMSYALDEGKHANLEFKKSYFSKISEVVNHPYLDENELKKIEELVLNIEEMDTARDIFLIACNTGLRIGDLLSFIQNPKFVNKNEKRFIQVRQSKTSNPVIIPINSTVLNIINKHNGNLPRYLHLNIINKNLKSICKKAKINSFYEYTRTEGGNAVTHSNPKYKFISTHTARRSFCTNAYYAGMPIQDIMAISGHKSERVFSNYIKVDLLDNASRISENPFFK